MTAPSSVLRLCPEAACILGGRGVGQGPSIPPVLGLLNQEPLTQEGKVLTAGPSPHGAVGRSGPPIWPAWWGAPGGVGDCALSLFLLGEETRDLRMQSPKGRNRAGRCPLNGGAPEAIRPPAGARRPWPARQAEDLGGKENRAESTPWPPIDALPLNAAAGRRPVPQVSVEPGPSPTQHTRLPSGGREPEASADG